MPGIHPMLAISAVALNSAVTLGAVWGFQLIGGYLPCPLCLQQRWAWYLVLVLTVILLFAGRTNIKLARAGLVVITVALLAGTLLAAYHAGIEWKFWPGPQSCSGGPGLSGGLPDLDNANFIRCDEVRGRFIGLSFAGWNAVISLATAAIAAMGLVAGGQSAQGSSSVSQ